MGGVESINKIVNISRSRGSLITYVQQLNNWVNSSAVCNMLLVEFNGQSLISVGLSPRAHSSTLTTRLIPSRNTKFSRFFKIYFITIGTVRTKLAPQTKALMPVMSLMNE